MGENTGKEHKERVKVKDEDRGGGRGKGGEGRRKERKKEGKGTEGGRKGKKSTSSIKLYPCLMKYIKISEALRVDIRNLNPFGNDAMFS